MPGPAANELPRAVEIGPGPSATRRLPQADDVALGVADVGGEAHLADRLLGLHDRAAVLGDLGEGLVDVPDVDDDHRAAGLVLTAPEHPAVDEAGLLRFPVLGDRPA